MQKGLVAAVCLTTAILFGPVGTGFARESGVAPQGGHGAVQSWGTGRPGVRGNVGGAPRPAWYGGFHGPWVPPHHPFFHDRFRGHPEVWTRIFIGPGFGWEKPWWWQPAYPYYAPPPVLVQEAAPVYVQQQSAPQQPSYWYYCPNPVGYYPYIKDCPAGWMTVVPPMGAGQPGMQQTQPSVFAYQVPFLTLILSHGQELGLTPEQLQELQELRTTFEKEAVARGAAIRAAEDDLNALLAKDQWDLPAIEAKVKQVASLQGDLRFAGIKTYAAGEALLTPAQLQKLEAIGQWTLPPPGGPERAGPRPPSGPGGPPAPQQ